MLRSLYVRDYALIEELDVEFDAGLNVITGETGAGKSILIGALQMILGERASTEAVRAGAKKAVVEGIFDGIDADGGGAIRSLLAENEIDEQPRIILRREITPVQSRGFINDTPATIQLMREVASHLIDLHGQHEHQSLLNVATHLDLLDSFGNLHSHREAYAEAYNAVSRLMQERDALRSRKREMEEKIDLYDFQIKDIDRIDPGVGEEEDLERERRILENAERLFEATSSLHSRMYEADHAMHDELVVMCEELEDLTRIDPAFETTLREIESARIIVSEAAAFLREYHADIEFNPQRLEELRLRSNELERLKRKYGGSIEAVLGHRRQIGAAFDEAQDFEGALQRVLDRIHVAQEELSTLAADLSRKRRDVAVRIAGAVEQECAKLGMPAARFEVRFSVQEDDHGWIRRTGESGSQTCHVRALKTGMDQAEFYMSTNLGEEPKPLSRIASGGEISRIMLALKTILARREALPILVFDEIDVGVSGVVAGKVGDSMHRLAENHQIIAITHLPQIAVRGDVHFVVEKHVEDGRTKTRIRRLTDEQRTRHVAGMMSGSNVSPAALESAREMLDESRRAVH